MLTCHERAGQDGEILCLVQAAREGGVITAHVGPEIEGAVRLRDIHHRLQDRQHAGEFFLIERTACGDVCIVLPRHGTGQLRGHRHRAAVVEIGRAHV